MSQTQMVVPDLSKNKFLTATVTIIFAVAIAVSAGLTSAINPFIALGGALIISLILLFIILKLPNFLVILVTFIIYTNTSVVMIKFHGIPATIGYALPLLLLFPFMWELIANKRKIRINFVFALMLVYFSIMILGSAFSRDISLAIPSLVNYIAEGLGLYFLLINTIRTPRLLKNVVWALLIGGAIIGGLSLYQQVTGTFDNNYWGFAQVNGQGFTAAETIQGTVTQPRVSGPIGEKNRFAQIMLMLVPIGLFQAWGEKSKKVRYLAYFLTVLTFIGGSLAFSRGAQVGLLLLIVIMAFMRYIKIHQLILILLSIILLVVAFPQNRVRFASLGAVFATEEEGGLRSADGAIQGRATEMLAAMLVFMDHPIIGVGPGMFGYEMAEYSKIVSLRNITATREPHSLYPGVAAETGILGFITLMAVFLYTLYSLAKARSYWLERNNISLANLSTGFFLAIVSYMTTGIFLHFAYIRYFWLLIALSVVVSSFKEADVVMEMKAAGEKTG